MIKLYLRESTRAGTKVKLRKRIMAQMGSGEGKSVVIIYAAAIMAKLKQVVKIVMAYSETAIMENEKRIMKELEKRLEIS